MFANVDPSQPGAAPLGVFADQFSEAIERKNVTFILELVNHTAEAFLTSIEKAPRDYLEKSLETNINSLKESKIPDELKQSAEKYLHEISEDNLLHMQYDVGNATLGINNYKTVLGAISSPTAFDEKKILQQAPIILEALDKILSDLSEHLQHIVDTAVHKYYSMTMDTITNHYENWQRTPTNETTWVDPQFIQNKQFGFAYPPRPFVPASPFLSPMYGPPIMYPGSVPPMFAPPPPMYPPMQYSMPYPNPLNTPNGLPYPAPPTAYGLPNFPAGLSTLPTLPTLPATDLPNLPATNDLPKLPSTAVSP